MLQSNKPYVILVGIDYSTESELALGHALGLAEANPNAELHVVHVISRGDSRPDEDAPAAGVRDLLTSDAPFVDAAWRQQLATYVAVSIGAFKKEHADAPTRNVRVVSHLRAHAPAHQIAQLASDIEADLVVVGTHGRSSVVRFFMGSVAGSVTRLANCPVLVFRPKGAPPQYPKIEPPCPRCVDARFASRGGEYWCEQHRERHGQRHLYEPTQRAIENPNLPLVFGQARSFPEHG